MKNLKLLISILIVFAVGLIVLIVTLNFQNHENKQNNTIITASNNLGNNSIPETENEIIGEAPELTFNTSLQQITENSMLYSISNNINKYFQYIKEGNIQAINELGGNTLYTISDNAKYVVKQAYSTSNEFMTKYYTYGILSVASGNYTAIEQEVYMIIYLTAENTGYKVQTITAEDFNNMQELSQDETIEILQGTYNIYEYEHIDNVKQMEIYLEDYTFQIFNNTEKAYNLLDEEYRNKRFGDKNKFAQFLNEKQNQLRNIEITQFGIDEGDDYTVYKGTDEYGNYYHIIETAYMEYTIILDNYTMQDYSSATTETKIEKSAEKFILMLNSADYTNAYDLLEPSFKQTNFPTEQDFINYIKSNWFERNIIASKEVDEEGICTVVMKQTLSTNSNRIEKQFKVNLGEEMDFTIEFNI